MLMLNVIICQQWANIVICFRFNNANTKLQSRFTRYFHILLALVYLPLWVGEVHRKRVFLLSYLDVDIGNELFHFHDDLSD